MATYETILEALIKSGVKYFGGVPSGTMIAFAGKSVPDGWLLCNGALVSRTTYAKLFAAIGTTWGAGDGSTTFKLPDADGRVMQGVTDASKVGQYLAAGLPDITGCGQIVAYKKSSFTGAFSAQNSHINMYQGSSGPDHGQIDLIFSASTNNSIYSLETVQPAALQTLIIIKV